ncbi:MAG TPA: hypothetical protein VM030_05600 [Acidimicrobiales bacterium]|nr:hypothetical protein [Acidimicrobiales bacterium]
MPVLDERHDFAHPVEGDEAWCESYYFNAYHPATDTGFYTRIGVRPNEGTIDVGLTLWLPGNEVASVRAVREQREMTDDNLEVGGVRYERRVPMKEWHLTAEADAWITKAGADQKQGRLAPIKVDATFAALIPAIGADGQRKEGEGASAATRQIVGKGHLEQAGRWTGGIEVDGARYDWTDDCRGNRDKSWGPRRWGGPKMWRWFSVNLGDDVHFGGIRIGTEAGDLHRGWVWRDGSHASIRDWTVRTEMADDGVTHEVSHVDATDSTGRVHQLRADVLRVHGIPPGAASTTVVGEGLAKWSCDGLEGYGISEYLHQLDDAGRPVVPVE